MFPCENKTEITAQQTEDMNFNLTATSTCAKAQRFIEGLGPLTVADLSEKKESKVFRDFIASDMSANCLVPSGALTAAWVEAGMIARSNARKGRTLCVEFVQA
jgi:hypothetical protein